MKNLIFRLSLLFASCSCAALMFLGLVTLGGSMQSQRRASDHPTHEATEISRNFGILLVQAR